MKRTSFFGIRTTVPLLSSFKYHLRTKDLEKADFTSLKLLQPYPRPNQHAGQSHLCFHLWYYSLNDSRYPCPIFSVRHIPKFSWLKSTKMPHLILFQLLMHKAQWLFLQSVMAEACAGGELSFPRISLCSSGILLRELIIISSSNNSKPNISCAHLDRPENPKDCQLATS